VLTIWDHLSCPPETAGEVWYWQSYTPEGTGLSIPRYVEDHAERLRAKYLAFIHELGEHSIAGARVVDHLDIGDGFSLWWMTLVAEKSPLKSPRVYSCIRLLALEELLRERRPSALTLVSSDRDLAEAVGELCRNLDIAFALKRRRDASKRWSGRRAYEAVPRIGQALISLARQLAVQWPLRRLGIPRWAPDEGAVFLCSYFVHLDAQSCADGRFHSRQWGPLPEHLRASGRPANWVHHFLRSAAVPDAGTGLAWLGRFNRDAEAQGRHAFLGTYLTRCVVARALRQWSRLVAAGWRLRRIRQAFQPQGSAVSLWPMLRRDWQTSIRGPIALENCLWVALFDALFRDLPTQGLGLYLCENQGWERALIDAWRRHGHGRLVGVQHATAPFWHLYYFNDSRSLRQDRPCAMPLPDLLAVNGRAAWDGLAATGYPASQMTEVEALRYLDVPRKPPTAARPARDGVPPRRVIDVLVLGEMVPSSMDHFLWLLQRAVNELPECYRFTLKPHPAFAVEVAAYPGLDLRITTDALDRIVGRYDIAYAANSTSASLEAYLAGLPVIVALDGRGLNLSPLSGQPGVRFVGTAGELLDALAQATTSSECEPDGERFFFLDAALPRWKRLLTLAE